MSGKATGTQPAAKKTAVKKVAAKAPDKPAPRTVAKKAAARRTPAKAKVEPNLTAQLGTTVEIELPVDATSVVIERPDGSETTVFASGGRALYVLDQLGVHVAGGLVVASVEETQACSVDRPAVREYLGVGNENRTDAQIDSALAAERSLQAAACRVPADDDLTPVAAAARVALEEALCRRVAVNLARRGIPLGMQMNDVGAARLSKDDPEVRRIEGPYRKRVVG